MNPLLQSTYPVYDPVQLLGVVTQIDNEVYTVLCDGKAWQCRRAASCLLAPEVGDTVLISGPDTLRVFLLAVIEQINSDQATICVDGRLNIRSKALNLDAEQGFWQVEHLNYSGAKLTARIGMTAFIGKIYEAIVERIHVMSQRSFRVTAEVDKTRAGTLDVHAEQAVRIHAPFTSMTAGEVVKVDAKQIHMG